jgi:hypothetical protein
MTLNPKYETVNYKCPDCSCDDDYIGEGKREQLKSKARNIIKTNYAKGWKGEEIQEILLKKGSMEPGLREVLLEDLIERNPKVIENVEKEAAAFLPRLKRMGETKPKGLEKSAPTSSEKAKVGEEDGEDGGWDILDEFGEAEWVEVPTPRSPRGFNQALRG